MINIITKPVHILFFTISVLRTLMLTSRSRWLIVWACFEVNSLSFLPLIIVNKANYQSERALIYFLVQGCGSRMLIIGVLNIKRGILNISSIIIIRGILLKLGIAPFHVWIPIILRGISWPRILLLLTWQKTPGLFMLRWTAIHLNTLLILIVIRINIVLGRIIGIKQTQIRPLLAYSSVAHIGWILASILISTTIILVYLTVYSVITLAIIAHIWSTEQNKSFSLNTHQGWIESINIPILLNILSLGGIPPILGFIPKLIVIIKSSYIRITITFIIVVLTCVSLYYYCSILIGGSSSPNKIKLVKISWPTNTWIVRTIILIVVIL